MTRCSWCGSVEWLDLGEGKSACKQCHCTPEQAREKARKAVLDEAAKRADDERHARRRQELDRRAALVVNATRGMPMPERIAAAKLLLWEYLRLSSEEWDKRLAAYRRRFETAGRPA